jgi:maleylacetate reductase
VRRGRVVFGARDGVVLGWPASEAIVGQFYRLGARRAILMVSGTLNRQTDLIEDIPRALRARTQVREFLDMAA